MSEITFTNEAYCKIVLHCAKYPHCAINGVLLAEAEPNNSSKDVVFVDAVPLFHLSLQLAPMAEIALTQIDAWAQTAGLVIAGYYYANDSLNVASGLEHCAIKIPEKIADSYNRACLVTIDNKFLTLKEEDSAFSVFQYTDKKWKLMDKACTIIMEQTLQTSIELLQKKLYNRLIDFDNHLDNISLDWRNIAINELIKKAE